MDLRLNTICLRGSLLVILAATALGSTAQVSSGQLLATADSLFLRKEWKAARTYYDRYMSDTVTNAISWNRLGFCQYHMGEYRRSLRSYEKALSLQPAAAVRNVIEMRMARSFARLKDKEKAIEWITQSMASGYSDVKDIDSLTDFAAIRQMPAYRSAYEKIYVATYPCAADPKQREFDFWVGEWDVYVNGTSNLAGHSLVQKVAGECALLENWESARGGGTGKSLNTFNPVTNSWEQYWIGASGGAQHFTEGVYKDTAMRFAYANTQNGQQQAGHFIFYNLGPDKVRQYLDVTTDGGKTYTVSYDFIYIRRKKD